VGLHKFIIAWLFLYLGGSAVGAPALPAPKEGVAILVNDKNSRIAIDAIDGTHKGVKPQGRYELAPGGHTVRARLFYRQGNVEWSSNTFVDYAFTALAGTVLKVVCEETRSTTTAGTWKMLILDSATGTDVRSGNAYPPPDGKQIQLQEEANFRELLQKAELGDAEAQYGLGLLYEGGNGVDRDPVRGIAWYRKAAEQGHPEAQFLLAQGYALGQGVPQDHAEAYVWFSLAAGNGDTSAPHFLDESAALLTPEALEAAKQRLRKLEQELPRKPVAP